MKIRLKPRLRKIDLRGDELLEVMKNRFKRLRLQIPRRPEREGGKIINPALPGDLTQLDDVQLGRLHGDFAALIQYTICWLSVLAVRTAVLRREDRIIRATVRLTKSGTVDDKAAKVEANLQVLDSSEKLLLAEGTEAMTRALLDGFTVGRDATSREMTRRMSLNPGSNR